MQGLKTRHSKEFNIFTESIDHDRSIYSEREKYKEKLFWLYDKLFPKRNIRNLIWCYRVDAPIKYFEMGKEVEYILNVDESRPVAYLDGGQWSNFLDGNQNEFRDYSVERKEFPNLNILIEAPITRFEIKRKITYRLKHQYASLSEYEIESVEEFDF